MSRTPRTNERGPFRADQLGPDDRYELDNGHAVYCAPTGHRGASATTAGALLLATDPKVTSAGIDAGFAPEPGTLRAPAISIGNVTREPGWGKGAPELAVEYADRGQDESMLQSKIADLLAHGTRVVWVVRLVGPRRVEVHEPGREMRVMGSGAMLEAPELLANAVAVDALYEADAAMDATLRNLLQRRGYTDLDQVRDEARDEGNAEMLRRTLRAVLATRGLVTTTDVEAAIDACHDAEQLLAWVTRASTATSLDEIR